MAMTSISNAHNAGPDSREHMLNDLDATAGKYDSRTVVVGITPGQPGRVVETAVRWAETGVIHNVAFVFVDPTLIEVDGHEEPLDSDSLDEQQFRDGAELAARMTRIIRAHGVHATFRRLGGDPAKRLASEARRLGAAAIIVGTRERGPMAAVNEWIRGSVSVHLEHSQSVPVVVIPLGDHSDAGHPIGSRDTSDDAMLDDAANDGGHDEARGRAHDGPSDAVNGGVNGGPRDGANVGQRGVADVSFAADGDGSRAGHAQRGIAQAEPAQAKPAQAKPAQAKPVQTGFVETGSARGMAERHMRQDGRQE